MAAPEVAGRVPEEGRFLGGVWVWAVIGTVAALVRCYRLDSFSYWLDEILEVYLIRYRWSTMWRSLRDGVFNAPLDYATLKTLEYLNPSDATRKLLAVTWGSACVLVFGLLLARRAGRAIGLTAAALLALAPYHVRYSQEVRPYSLGMFLLCLSLLLLDRYLERPTLLGLTALFLACLATAYTMYLAALVLLISGSALLLEDSFAGEPARRQEARRFLKASPLFAGALALGYWPWWPVFLRAIKSPPLSTAPDFHWNRVGRLFTYFGFGPGDWRPPEVADFLLIGLIFSGVLLAMTRFKILFVSVWAFGGIVVIEVLEHRHAVYDSVFHYLPAGMALTALLAVPIGLLLQSPARRLIGYVILIGILVLDWRALTVYFRQGRPDWRPLAEFLRKTPRSEQLFVNSPYTQLCLGYYVVGPDWLCCKRAGQREITSVDGSVTRLLAAWRTDENAWLVIPGHHEAQALRDWSARYPTLVFPTAEGDGGAVLRHLLRSMRQ